MSDLKEVKAALADKNVTAEQVLSMLSDEMLEAGIKRVRQYIAACKDCLEPDDLYEAGVGHPNLEMWSTPTGHMITQRLFETKLRRYQIALTEALAEKKRRSDKLSEALALV